MDDVTNEYPDGFSLDDLGLGGGETAGDGAEGLGSPPSGAAPSTAAPTQSTSPEAVPVTPTGAPTGDPWMVPPKSWKKDLHTHYATLPPDVQRYVHEREQQALQGVMQYKQQVDAYNGIFEPYKAIMQQAGIEPTTLVKNLAANHHVLATGTPEQKAQVASTLLREYGIDPRSLIFGQQPQGQQQPAPAALPPDYEHLRTSVSHLERTIMEGKRQEIQKQVDAFAAANPHYAEVESDIAELIGSGAAQDLQTAYDIAIYRNPEIRQKVLDDLLAKSTQQARQVSASKQSATRLNLTPGATAGKPVVGSIDDTMNAIADKHFRH